MEKIVQRGNTLYVYVREGTRITAPGFYRVDDMVLRSNCIFGRDMFFDIGLKRFWFKRVKNIILVPIP